MSEVRDEREIFLGQPGYGHLTAGAAKGFWRATARPNRLWFHYNQGSLLGANFNTLWCKALNLGVEGRPPKYFAMQHSDIEPEDFWLDKLIEELEARNLDVLGVPAPIKDNHGLTSIALARDDGDTWRVHCRLTSAEIQRLPETFTTDDIPGNRPLLLNTGLWVCRFNMDWATKVHFEINDRIVQTPDGKYTPQTEPEDWFFSRLCHELGLKIGCTRKIKLVHAGEMRWNNWEVFGEPYDSAYVEESIFEEHGEWFPHDVAGWLSETEGEELRRLADGKMVLEIGAYCGRSTICLAQDARQVYSVDTFDGRGTPVEGETRGTFTKNIARYGVSMKVNSIVGDSETVIPKLPRVFDLAFIDGSHDYESVTRDIELARDVLKHGGLLAFHDYETNEPGVTAAVKELCGEGGELLHVAGSLAVVRPPARVLMET